LLIYHLTPGTHWDSARDRGSYTTASLAAKGFIHCSSAEQVLQVANAFYQDLEDPVVLCIDAGRLESPLRWEAPEGGDPFAAETFPHVYGAINLDAVVGVNVPVRGPDGLFTSW
jgi:uncharacterized protein (DUF952 family)